MGKPGKKNQSSISNIFKRVPNYNYKEQGSEAIVPGIGGMGEQSSENVYMSDAQKSPLQQAGLSPLKFGNSPLKADIRPEGFEGGSVNEAASMLTGTGRTPYTTADLKNLALGSDERRQAYDDLQWAHDDTIAGDHEGSYTNKPDVEEVVEEEKPNLEEAVEGEVVEGEGGDAVMLDEVTVEAAPKGRAKRIADMEQKITDTIGDEAEGTQTSAKAQRKAKRLKGRLGRMKDRQARKAKRVARRDRVKEARKDPVAAAEEQPTTLAMRSALKQVEDKKGARKIARQKKKIARVKSKVRKTSEKYEKAHVERTGQTGKSVQNIAAVGADSSKKEKRLDKKETRQRKRGMKKVEKAKTKIASALKQSEIPKITTDPPSPKPSPEKPRKGAKPVTKFARSKRREERTKAKNEAGSPVKQLGVDPAETAAFEKSKEIEAKFDKKIEKAGDNKKKVKRLAERANRKMERKVPRAAKKAARKAAKK